MFMFIGALVLLSIIAIFCALAIGKRTDQKIHANLGDQQEQTIISVKFPEDVFHAPAFANRKQARSIRARR